MMINIGAFHGFKTVTRMFVAKFGLPYFVDCPNLARSKKIKDLNTLALKLLFLAHV